MSIKVIEMTEEEIHRYRCGAKKSQLLDRIRGRTGCSAVEAVQALRLIEKEGLSASLAALPGGGVK